MAPKRLWNKSEKVPADKESLAEPAEPATKKARKQPKEEVAAEEGKKKKKSQFKDQLTVWVPSGRSFEA